MYKVIVTDLDGTLLNEHHSISNYTREVLLRAQRSGYKIIVATGRHHIDLKHIVDHELKMDDIYRISANGARCYNPQNELIYKQTVPPKVVEELLGAKYSQKDIITHVYQGDKWYSDQYDEISAAHMAMSGFMFELADYSQKKDFTDCMKICYISRQGDHLLEVKEKVESIAQDDLNFAFTLPVCFEVMSKYTDKGHALAKVLEVEGVSPSEVIAFGDGMNDLGMLQVAGKGIVMGNALESLKEALPNNLQIGPNYEDSVAKYIEENLL